MAIPYVHTWWQNKFLIKIATSNCIDMYVNVRNCRDNIGNFAMSSKSWLGLNHIKHITKIILKFAYI